MASNSNSKPSPLKFGKCGKLSLLLLLLLALWRQCAHAMDIQHPVCGGGLSAETNLIGKECSYNGFIDNPDPQSCKDRYVCYRGPGQSCDENIEMRCNPQLVCNKCNHCQNCIDGNCNLELCRHDLTNSILKRWIKRFERNLLEGGSSSA